MGSKDFALPQEVLFCKTCVISNQRPNSTVEFRHINNEKKETIAFDENDECSACRFSRVKNNDINWQLREKKLLELLDKHRKTNGDYDVIVPGSGGKDSAYTSHILKAKYGMNPLTVTWAPHKYTEIGWTNFQNWVHIGGLDNILLTPNGMLHRYLTQQAFLNLLHPFQPFIIGQRIIGPSLAAKFNVKLVMYGENQAEYGNNIADNETPTMNAKFFSNEKPENLIIAGKTVEQLIAEGRFQLGDFAPYLPPKEDVLIKAGIEVHYLGYYKKWDPQECYYYAVENTGFRANSERTEGTYSKYSSIDDQIDMFHYYTTLIKFGMGRATYDAAQEIRNGKISREEGINLVKKYELEFPKKYFKDFLQYIDITEEQFWTTVDSFRPKHLWAKQNNEWFLRNTIWNT
jgi:N-acetyl sugar amidotransferase